MLPFVSNLRKGKGGHMNATDNKEPIKYNHLAAAEMDAEENYNQIDGVINNYKPSILEYLKQNKLNPPVQGNKCEKLVHIEK